MIKAEIAQKDDLTGLLSRRKFLEEFSEVLIKTNPNILTVTNKDERTHYIMHVVMVEQR